MNTVLLHISRKKKKKQQKKTLSIFKLQFYFIKNHWKDESAPNSHICHYILQVNFIGGDILLKMYQFGLDSILETIKPVNSKLGYTNQFPKPRRQHCLWQWFPTILTAPFFT